MVDGLDRSIKLLSCQKNKNRDEISIKGRIMKLHSIALASLLGAGLLMTSGCGTDEIKDAINDIAKPNVVYVVNGHDANITAYANSDSALLQNAQMKVFALTGQSTTDVYYKIGENASGHTSLAYGNAYLYVASPTCNVTTNGFGTMTDTSSGEGVVELINATNVAYTATTTNSITVNVDGEPHPITVVGGTSVAACSKASTSFKISDLGIVNGSEVSVTIGGTTSKVYEVKDNVPTSVDVDVVYLGGEKGVAVPLVKFDDIL